MCVRAPYSVIGAGWPGHRSRASLGSVRRLWSRRAVRLVRWRPLRIHHPESRCEPRFTSRSVPGRISPYPENGITTARLSVPTDRSRPAHLRPVPLSGEPRRHLPLRRLRDGNLPMARGSAGCCAPEKRRRDYRVPGIAPGRCTRLLQGFDPHAERHPGFPVSSKAKRAGCRTDPSAVATSS